MEHRTTEIGLNGHTWRLNRVRLWVSTIGGVLAIVAMIWGFMVWAGDSRWQTKTDAKSDKTVLQQSIANLNNDVSALKNQIGDLSKALSDSIEKTERSRLEDQIADINMSLYQIRRQINEDGDEARETDRQQLQILQSRKERLLRQLRDLRVTRPDSR